MTENIFAFTVTNVAKSHNYDVMIYTDSETKDYRICFYNNDEDFAIEIGHDTIDECYDIVNLTKYIEYRIDLVKKENICNKYRSILLKLGKDASDGGLTAMQIHDIYGTYLLSEILNMTVNEVVEKYDAWEKNNVPLRRYDQVECIDNSHGIGVVLDIDDDVDYVTVHFASGTHLIKKNNLRKTGINFATMFEKMSEKLENAFLS